MTLISKEIEDHYLRSKESERLTGALGELERLRTQAILAQHLPPAPAVICDIGGAAGVYSFPLATQGYQVRLVDPVDLHLEQARSHAVSSGVGLTSITHGDARHLEIPSGSADAVLLLGPLYHLVESADRQRALGEAHRILKRDGVLFAAGISRFASLMAGLSIGAFADPEFRRIVAMDLAFGQHRNPTDNLSYFTTAYFHRPEELAGEVREAGFGDVQMLAVEGPVWSAAAFRQTWDDLAERQNLMEFLSLIEREASVLGASAHFVALGYRRD
jgi:ubiquinone/menaquinone biosynthesis C-methylase UbiE